MELEHSFTIPVPPERAWKTLLDVELVAPCMPGATLDSVEGDVITGRIKVKVGPVTLTYAGKARFSERDEQAHSVTLEASGRETRGTGTASATVHSIVRGEGDQSEVVVRTSLAVTGRPAQFGRGMLTEVGGRLIDKFAANLAAQLASEPAAPVSGNGAAPGGDRDASIDDLQLPVRATASMRLAGITTVGELATTDEQSLLQLAGIGPQTIRQIRGKLAERGLELAGAAGQPAAAPRPVVTPAPAPAQLAGVSPAPGVTVPQVPAPAARAVLPPRPRPADEEAIDLLNVAGLPVLKRILPAAGLLAGLLTVLLVVLRRRRRPAGRA